ncbi:hypothetical protein GCM10009837_41470 [Streptomyces durmitorensis]|uniref:PBS lyase n=1 Tax=Streptomyces durmitorensis TaxID=319947 RepID=A0ABY4Q6P1_9ACTN|nr:hypothetical protein [Streptomyces durmitorensis]UQT60816.1 hypothetical protein M4V62_40305 [Streptomyces durmitorensis]
MAAYEASQTPSSQPQPTPEPLTSAWLKAHFDPLPFPARMSALARYARALTTDAYGTLRDALAAGTPDERHTGLFLAVTRRDLTTVAEALTDPLLRRRALAAAIRLPVPEAALEQLALSDIRTARHETYRVLRLSRRHTLAARLLPEVHERFGARDAAQLLPACPAEAVDAWLPRLDPPTGALSALTRAAPIAVARLLVTRGESRANRDRHGFSGRHRAVASVAAERDPEAGLLLLARAPDLLTPQAARTLLRHPARVLEILRAAPPNQDGSPRELRLSAGALPPATRRALRELPPADLVDLARRCPVTQPRHRGPGRHAIEPDSLLMMLPAPERRRLVEERTARRRSVRSLPIATLTALAPADRAALVTPWVERWSRQEWTSSRLAVALPLALGEPVLRDMAGQHRVHQRLMAWPALLACAELEGDPHEFARIAGDCERAWHDQEEVRRAALQQLAGAPPYLLAALPDRVLRDAALTTVQSRDSTTHTLAAAEQLLRRAAESAAATGRTDRAAHATELLCQLVSDPRSRQPVAPLRIGEEAARAIWSAASPHTPVRPDLRIAVAELLAPHLSTLPELDTLVRAMVLESDDPDVAARAAAAWTGPAELRERRSAELIGYDASFAAVPIILRTVVTRRTDLLDSVLVAAQEGLTGRVRPRATAWASGLRPGVTGRWLPAQRRAWDEHHARVAADELAPLRTRADAAAQVREPELLTTLAQSAPQPIAAAALGALGDLLGTAHDGAPAATESLLDFLLRHAATGGVRGRAAMASVRRLLEAVPDPEAVALLAPVACASDAPVGSRKEAVRALGALTGDAAFEVLVAAWDAPGQHRDVRAVVARHLLAAIARPAIADRLVRAADEPAVREAVVHARVGPVSEAAGEPYANFLARLVREGDEETVVAACRALPAWFTPESADALRAVADVATDPARRRREWDAAAQQLAWFPLGPVGGPILRGVIRRLQELAGTPDPQARADALRRLSGIGEALCVRRGTAQTLLIADALALSMHAVGLYADAAALAWDTSLAAVRHGEHHAARWERLLELVEERPERLPLGSGFHPEVPTPRARAALLSAARLLRERGTPVAGVMALALVRAGGRATSWDETWRAELVALRDHADHDTATAAFLLDPEHDH